MSVLFYINVTKTSIGFGGIQDRFDLINPLSKIAALLT